MDLQTLAALGEFIGGIGGIIAAIAVVASLVFVGMQLMLDRKVAIAEQYFNRTESVKEDRRMKMVSEAYLQYKEEAWAIGRRPQYWNED